MSDRESRIERARAAWGFRGQRRPPFAVAPGPGEESVWDYPRPPRIERDSRRVRVVHGGVVIADSERAYRVLETASPPTFYVPPEDVLEGALVPAEGKSLCEWKGVARYWSLRSGDGLVEQAAWSYPDPFPEFELLRAHLAFYPARVECRVDRHRVTPQPGGFYGGWVTPEVVGPFKGEAGTEGW